MRQLTPSRLIVLTAIGLLIALAVPTAASAQATRTWVSGVGDDANPCSRTAPCKTFAGAISKTAAKGEINCLDPGGFGGVTITKSITIKCHYTEGGVLVSGTNAIVVNAAATDKVVLRGLDINGIGTGLNGVRILQAKSVRILDSEIYGFVRNGIDFEPTNTLANLVVHNTHIHDVTGNGVLVAPPSTGTNARSHVRYSLIENNGCGYTVTNRLPDPAFVFTTRCGTQAAGAGGGSPKGYALHSAFIQHDGTGGRGLFTNGGTSVIVTGDSQITNNTTGVEGIDNVAQIGGVYSFEDNYVDSNGVNGTFKGNVVKVKRHFRTTNGQKVASTR
ncbi:MAG: right-handed parallel beta-helix repeat-containing protein [Actinomycetota bacterium]|nr:right-handed parallel beta-helix repeat-containing protein [Actinomycetota bacterium]